MLIKKFIHIILSLLLMVSTMGITINKHYSNNELFSTTIFVEAEGCCEIPLGCCHEESTFVQVKEDYIPSRYKIENFKDRIKINLPYTLIHISLHL